MGVPGATMWHGIGVLAAMAIAAALSACTALGGLRPASHDLTTAHTETVFVASTRDEGGLGAAPLTYAAYRVAVPPARQPGDEPQRPVLRIEPLDDFLTVEARRFQAAAEFGRAVTAEATAVRSGTTETLIFVHGFNTTLEESLVRLAQIGNDIDLPSAQILYAWPAQDRILAYLEDTARAAEARDGLIELLQTVATSRTQRIVLVGYSMGAAIVVDALAEMRARGSTGPFAKLDVVLLSPDLDLIQFRERARGIGSLPRPLVVYGSSRDLPLQMIARFVADGRPRLGALPDPNLLSDVEMTYIDVADVGHTGYGHFAVGSAPALIAAINAMDRPDLVDFAIGSAGAIPGATVSKYGSLAYITLPRMSN
jgi:esterase/lipase superfamily enzyme